MWAEALWKRDLTVRELAAYDADTTNLARTGNSLESLGGKTGIRPSLGQFATEQCGFILYFKQVFNLNVSLNSVI